MAAVGCEQSVGQELSMLPGFGKDLQVQAMCFFALVEAACARRVCQFRAGHALSEAVKRNLLTDAQAVAGAVQADKFPFEGSRTFRATSAENELEAPCLRRQAMADFRQARPAAGQVPPSVAPAKHR